MAAGLSVAGRTATSSSRLQVSRFSICPDNSTGDGSAFAAILTEIVTGTRHYDTLEEGAHRRFAGGLFEDIEAAWEPVMSQDMHDIKFEGDPEKPRRRVAEPSDVVAYVQFLTAADDVALRTCYPHKALEPLLPLLETLEGGPTRHRLSRFPWRASPAVVAPPSRRPQSAAGCRCKAARGRLAAPR